MVVVIFHLQKDALELDPPNIPKSMKKRTKSVSQEIKELLKVISHQELMTFILENSKKDKKFRACFLTSFGHLSQNKSKEFYQKQIHSILQTAAGREGWIGWSEMKYVVNTTQPLIDNAENYLANKNYENVFFISTSLLEEMTKALQYGDDSNGDLGYFIRTAIALLSELTKVEISLSLKRAIFEYCISAFDQKLFKGWDWHLEMLHIAGDLAAKESEVDTILNHLETVKEEYDIEYAQWYKLELLNKHKDQKEVEEFISKYISNSRIRRQEIETAFENKDFARAIDLAKDGIVYDEQNKPGLVKDWYNWLLKVALAQAEKSKVVEYARLLFIEDFYTEKDYYQILKDTIEPEKWHSFLEELIKEITPKTRWTYTALLQSIYIKEEWWDRLFIMLKNNLSLENIEQNELYLSNDYAMELVGLYKERIIKYVEQYVGRKHYQTACRYMRRMKHLGGQEQVEDLIVFLRKQYPKRKALMDELTRV